MASRLSWDIESWINQPREWQGEWIEEVQDKG